MAWEEDSCICLNMQLIAILSRIGVVKKSREKENKELPPQPPPRGRKDGGSCFSLHTGIRFQYNDAQLSGTDGYAPKIGD